MQQLEPTYLRYVYDGLSKGSISSNNPTSLPIGLIGLFEDEFPSSMHLVERMTILNEVSEIIDIHEWLDIKSKINKLQFSN